MKDMNKENRKEYTNRFTACTREEKGGETHDDEKKNDRPHEKDDRNFR